MKNSSKRITMSLVTAMFVLIALLAGFSGAKATTNLDTAGSSYEVMPDEGTKAAGDEDCDLNPEHRQAAEQRIFWKNKHSGQVKTPRSVKILAINDFHGQISSGKKVGGKPVGSAAVLASYLKAAEQGKEDHTIILHDGDFVGASPADSALLQDEPSIMFMNMLANDHCGNVEPARGDDSRDGYDFEDQGERYYHHEEHGDRLDPRCNLVGTVGNHEFDEGRAELLRLVYGGNYSTGPFLENPYSGAHFPYVSSNVIDTRTGRPVLPPYVIKKIHGTPVAFIGAILKDTPSIVTASGVAGLTFLDEAESINKYVRKLKRQHVHTIIAMIHQGGLQTTYTGPTTTTATVSGELVNIVNKLDDEVDVVISGHSHSFTNAILKNQNGKEILVTQAFSAGTAYADIDLEIDPRTNDVVTASAAIVTTYADAGPGLTPDPDVANLTASADAMVAPLVNRVIGTAAQNITSAQNAAGESALGNLIADSQRAAMATDFAFMNPGGIRANINAGAVTWGALFTVQPFSNYLVKMNLTGQQIYDVLNQQWSNPAAPKYLQISGLTYTWDAALPVGSRIVEVRKGGVLIDRNAVYSATVNNFLAGGGDGFVALKQGTNQVYGPIDLDGLVTYLQGLAQPFSATIEGRIMRIN